MARAAAAALRRRGCSLCWHGKACGRVIWRELKSRHWPIARFSTLLFFWRRELTRSPDVESFSRQLTDALAMNDSDACRFCLLKGRILDIASVAREVAIHAMDNSRIYVFLHLEAKACCGYDDDDDDPFAKRSSNFHPSFYLIS